LLEAVLDPEVELTWWESGEWDCHGREAVPALLRERTEEGAGQVEIEATRGERGGGAGAAADRRGGSGSASAPTTPTARRRLQGRRLEGALREADLASGKGARKFLYPEGPLASLLSAEDLTGAAEPPLVDGSIMFLGTRTAHGGIRPSDRFRYQLEDPVLGRSIEASYTVRALPLIS
jgi:hypothetical protein